VYGATTKVNKMQWIIPHSRHIKTSQITIKTTIEIVKITTNTAQMVRLLM